MEKFGRFLALACITIGAVAFICLCFIFIVVAVESFKVLLDSITGGDMQIKTIASGFYFLTFTNFISNISKRKDII